MKELLEKLMRSGGSDAATGSRSKDGPLRRRVSAMYSLLTQLYGADRLVLKAGKMEALSLMRSERVEDQVLALQRLVYENPSLDEPPPRAKLAEAMEELEDLLAESIARRNLEEQLEKKVSERMQQRHEEYLREIKSQIVKEETGPENPTTLRKLADLEKLQGKSLTRSLLELLRPQSLEEVVGQEQAVQGLLSRLASPYPQHVILYGPPGVGKTTVARLALERAKTLAHTPFTSSSPFVEVDGTTLRWDPREVTNPLLGSVHDPIYQGARRDLAEGGIPEPKPGLVTEAHSGVLFIDEVGEMDAMLQNKLLKVLEDKRVKFDSSYYDPSDPNVPQFVKKLFDEGAPADFVLVAATTREPEDLSPALRSRCAEVFFEPLSPTHIVQITQEAAARLQVTMGAGVADLIAEFTVEGRKAASLLADAFSLAMYEYGAEAPEKVTITRERVQAAIRASRLTPNSPAKARSEPAVGRIFGLGASGFLGQVLEFEAMAFPARDPGKGTLRLNDTAGSMTRDSLFNAAAVVRSATGRDLADFDVHVNVLGGGRIDGPSAGLAIFLAMISAIENRPLQQDVALTGEVSLRGDVRAVGGISQKLYGARQAGMRTVIIPVENVGEVPADANGLKVVPVANISQAMDLMFADGHVGLVREIHADVVREVAATTAGEE